MTLTKCWRIALFTTLLSILFFYNKEISFEDYILIAYLILVFLLFSYRFFCCNKNIVLITSCIYIPNIIVYLFYHRNYHIVLDQTDWVYILFCSSLAISLFFYLSRHFYLLHKNKVILENYFPAREEELNYLAEILKKQNVIGINSDWGNGKSFLLQLFAQKNKVHNFSWIEKKGYHLIAISVMSSTVETIESFIISEIESFLDTHGVFSYSSQKIRKFFSQPLLKSWSFVFDDKNSYTSLIKSLVDDVKELGITLILSFEDIERIKDPEIIHKIFCISEQINCNYIKIVFQYDEDKLFKILQTADKNYIEKYIPYSISLRAIPFQEVIEKCIEHRKNEGKAYKNISKQDFRNIFEGVTFNSIFEDNADYYYHLNVPSSSIRKKLLFLEEIDTILDYDFFKSHKHIVITFFIVKYFYSEVYSQIEPDKSLLSSIQLDVSENNENKYFSILKCINLIRLEKIKKDKLTNNLKNFDKLIILHTFGYKFDHIYCNFTEDCAIEDREYNDTIDSIIWKLINIGHSGLTEKRQIIRKIEAIFSKTDDVNKQAAELEVTLLIDDDIKKQIPAHFRNIEIEYFTFLFSILEDSVEIWKKWINLVIAQSSTTVIKENLFSIFIRFRISIKDILFFAIDKFNSMNIKTSYNNSSKYLNFLRTYLKHIKDLGFFTQINLDTNNLRYEQIVAPEDFFNSQPAKKEYNRHDALEEILKDILEELNSKRNQFNSIPRITSDFGIIIKFVEKNLDLINAPEETKEVSEDNWLDDVKTISDEEKYEVYLHSNKKIVDGLLNDEYTLGKKSINEIKYILELREKKLQLKDDINKKKDDCSPPKESQP